MIESMDKRQVIVFLGVGFLLVGSFAPLIYVPFGSVNYIANGRGDGIILLILTGMSAYFIAAEKYTPLLIRS